MKYRHKFYCNDPKSPARALTFNALRCGRCDSWYMSATTDEERPRVGVVPWITAAATLKLKQLKEVPPDNCQCANI